MELWNVQQPDKPERRDTAALLEELHAKGCLLAMVYGDRWVGISECDHKYWMLEGDVPVDGGPINCRWQHCYYLTYDLALAAFHRWWDNDFMSKPV